MHPFPLLCIYYNIPFRVCQHFFESFFGFTQNRPDMLPTSPHGSYILFIEATASNIPLDIIKYIIPFRICQHFFWKFLIFFVSRCCQSHLLSRPYITYYSKSTEKCNPFFEKIYKKRDKKFCVIFLNFLLDNW